VPQLSSAVHVRVIARFPVQLAVPSASTKVIDLTPLQSVAVAIAGIVGDRQDRASSVILAGQVMEGPVVSTTVTVE